MHECFGVGLHFGLEHSCYMVDKMYVSTFVMLVESDVGEVSEQR